MFPRQNSSAASWLDKWPAEGEIASLTSSSVSRGTVGCIGTRKHREGVEKATSESKATQSQFWNILLYFVVRGHVHMTSAKFRGFLTPSPPCLHFGPIRSFIFVQPSLLHLLLGYPPPSTTADIIYNSSRNRKTNIKFRQFLVSTTVPHNWN